MELVDEQERQQINIIAQNIETLVNSRKIVEAVRLLEEVAQTKVMPNKKMVFLINLLEIYRTRDCNMFFSPGDKVSDMQEKYIKAAFLLQRKLYGFSLNKKEIFFYPDLLKRRKG